MRSTWGLLSDRLWSVVRGSPLLKDSGRRAHGNSSGCRGLPGPTADGLLVPERGRPRSGRRPESRSFHLVVGADLKIGMSTAATSSAQYPAGRIRNSVTSG